MNPASTIETIRVQLNYPLEQINEPILYHLVTDFDLIPNIRRANVDVRLGGFIFLELTGAKPDLDRALIYLQQQGIEISAIGLNGAEEWVI